MLSAILPAYVNFGSCYLYLFCSRIALLFYFQIVTLREVFCYILATFLLICKYSVAYICSKPIGVDDDDEEITDKLPSTSIKVNLSLIFFATTLEFSINF